MRPRAGAPHNPKKRFLDVWNYVWTGPKAYFFLLFPGFLSWEHVLYFGSPPMSTKSANDISEDGLNTHAVISQISQFTSHFTPEIPVTVTIHTEAV